MRVPRGGLRGWGGVTAMGAACAVTVALAVVPLTHAGGAATGGTGGGAVGHRTDSVYVSARTDAATRDCPSTGRPPEASLSPSAGAGPAVDRLLARRGADRKLVVGVDQNSYRWGYLNPTTNRFEGFDIDLARAIAADLFGSPDAIRFKPVPTSQRIAALDAGTVDVVVRTMTIDCSRITKAAFSTAYFKAGQQVLAPKGSPITGYDESLRNKRICTATGSTASQVLEDPAQPNPHHVVFWDKDEHKGYNPDGVDVDDLSVPNQLDCLVRLQLGLVDAVITDNALAAAQAAQDPAVEPKGAPFTTEYYGVAVKKGDDDLVRRINHVLEHYRSGGSDSAWSRSYATWLRTGPDDTTRPPAATYLPGT